MTLRKELKLTQELSRGAASAQYAHRRAHTSLMKRKKKNSKGKKKQKQETARFPGVREGAFL